MLQFTVLFQTDLQALLTVSENRIMSAIQDFIAAQNDFNARLGTAMDGITGDVAALNAKITELQANLGNLSPEDQAALNVLQAQGQALAERLEGLDALTPPEVPTA